MPTRDRPEPPTGLERDQRDALARLEDLDADRLHAVGRYLEELATWTESTDVGNEGDDSEGEVVSRAPDTDDDVTDDSDDDDDLAYPADVPDRAEVTVKEIGGTTYYYYQWREGDRIESKTVHRENGHR